MTTTHPPPIDKQTGFSFIKVWRLHQLERVPDSLKEFAEANPDLTINDFYLNHSDCLLGIPYPDKTRFGRGLSTKICKGWDAKHVASKLVQKFGELLNCKNVMHKATKIIFSGREGYNWTEPDKPVIVTGDSDEEVWSKANAYLRFWGSLVPDLGCDKCGFTVVFEDGEEYRGRYDLKKEDAETADLGSHIAWYLDFCACKNRPSHFTDKDWQQHCQEMHQEGFKAQAEAFAASYEFVVNCCDEELLENLIQEGKKIMSNTNGTATKDSNNIWKAIELKYVDAKGKAPGADAVQLWFPEKPPQKVCDKLNEFGFIFHGNGVKYWWANMAASPNAEALALSFIDTFAANGAKISQPKPKPPAPSAPVGGLPALMQMMKDLTEQVAQMRQELQEIKKPKIDPKEIEELKSQIAQLKAENAELVENLKQEANDRTKAQQETQQLRTELEQVKSQLSEWTGESASPKIDLGDLAEEFQSRRIDLGDLMNDDDLGESEEGGDGFDLNELGK